MQALKKLLYSNTLLQYNSEDFRFCKLYQNDSFIDNRILYRRLRQTGEPDRVVLFAPPTMRDAILHKAHGATLSGHGGTLKTKELFLARHGPRHSDTLEIASEVPVTKDKGSNQASFTVTITSVYSTQPKNSCRSIRIFGCVRKRKEVYFVHHGRLHKIC